MEHFANLKKTFRLTLIANLAIIATLLLLAVVVEIIKSVVKPFPGLYPMPNRQVMRYLFYGLAVLAVVLVRILGHALARSHQLESPQILVQKLSRAAIFTSSLAEIPALLGFVLFFLSGASRDFYYLLFVSLFLEYMYFPRIKAWEEMIKRAYPQANI